MMLVNPTSYELFRRIASIFLHLCGSFVSLCASLKKGEGITLIQWLGSTRKKGVGI